METKIGASVFVDPSEIRHEVVNGNPTITLGLWPDVRRVDLHLGDVAGIDKMIAELVALKQEMAPPIIDSDRDCDAVNPDGSGEHCYKSGAHGLHRDSNGDEWCAAPVPSAAQQPETAAAEPDMCDSELPLTHGGHLGCILDQGHYGAHSALAGKYRWLGHGDDARDEEGNRIAPVSVTA